jgi:hypothetical protein
MDATTNVIDTMIATLAITFLRTNWLPVVQKILLILNIFCFIFNMYMVFGMHEMLFVSSSIINIIATVILIMGLI